MEATEISEQVFQLFNESCVEMFSDLNCSINEASSPDEHVDEAPISDIDAGSEDLEIRLLLRFPYSVLAMTYPVDDVLDVDDSKLEDWLSEMSNQLIGRLKNKLIKHEVYLNMGLPENHFGLQPEQLKPEGFEHRIFYYDIDNEIFECHVSVDVINEHMTFHSEESSDDMHDEGELELF